ncbi:MATE family efflux transporter [Sansalvadorimonas verongulae]|uniref:MATE family efflux transporter n=1 Tax=Sansalvadorimonas verongulae TaxID=2172824 RepID=UPI0012BBBA85|nr:MATE family efflux transporter [Sansalvadorimonas verongulae]MTI14230.1 MATE family efflux transporter [Sansalvadorimonas verongulae]
MSESTTKTSEISNQPISKLFWRYTLPAVMGMVVNGLYAVIDGIFIGRAVGAEGLAAINLAWPLFGVLIGIGLMIGIGASAQYSIARGAGKHGKAQNILGNAFVLLPLFSFIFGAVLYNFTVWGMELQKASDQVMHHGTAYLHLMSLGALPAMAGAALPMMVRNDEQPRLATQLMCLGAGLNIALDWLFVVYLKQEVAGAAVATVIAQLVVTILGAGYFFSNRALEKLTLKTLNLNLKLSWHTLATGFSSLIMFMYFSFVLIIHNRLFSVHGGVVTLAAFSIVGYVQTFYYMFAEGVGHGIQPLVSYNKGAGNSNNIRAALMLAMKVVLGVGIATLLLINLLPQTIAGIFAAEDQALIEATTTGFRLHLFTLFLDGLIVVGAAYFQALALARLATFISMGNMLVQLPLLATLPNWLGVTGVWISMPISNIFLAVVVILVIRRDLRMRKALKPVASESELQNAA